MLKILYNINTENTLKSKVLIKLESKTERIGETRVMNCGMEATIIAYRKYIDIDVKFEDGTVRYNVSYHAFNRGCVGPRSRKS